MPNQFVLDAAFLNHNPSVRLQKITVHQQFGKHGLAVLDYQFRAKREYVMPSSETPVRLLWGSSPLGTRNFYGYVNHYDTDVSNDTVTRMYALGTSKVLNTAKPTTWHGMTHSSIAREFAKRHNLRSIVTRTKRVLPAWATGNRTDFLALNALADEVGFYTWVDGSTLYFLDSLKVLRTAASMRVPSFDRWAVRESRVTAGRDAPHDDSNPVRRRVLYGLDEKSNEFFTATSGDPNLPTAVVGTSVNNYGQAQDVASAQGSKDANYFMIKATVNGDSSIYPGSLVYMGAGLVDNDQQGYWFVTEATHHVSRDDFVTTWNGVRGTDSTPRQNQVSTVSVRRQTPAVIRRGNIWEAEVQEHANA